MIIHDIKHPTELMINQHEKMKHQFNNQIQSITKIENEFNDISSCLT